MAKHLIAFGHSPGGKPDPGTTSGSLKEAIEIRRLKPYLKKWAKKSKDSFTFYEGNMYLDRSISKQKGYDTVTELHLDGPKGSGGHVIIFRAYKPDAIDKRLRDMIKSHWGIVGYLQNTDGFSYRSNLYNLNEAARHGINYRLLELFFMSNNSHRQHYLSNLDLIAKEIVESITNESLDGEVKDSNPKPRPKPTPKPKSKPKPVSKSIWKDKPGPWRGNALRLNAKGQQVRELQQLLASKYYYPEKGAKNNGVDGYFGAKTKNAVERYQSMHGLTVDGIAGKATYSSLKGTSSPKRSSVNIESLAKQVVRGIDTKGRRIPTGVNARARHFGISVSDMRRVQKRVNQLMS